MASTVWKGQLTFGMVSFPVRLLRAARKERLALKYVRESPPEGSDESEEVTANERAPLAAANGPLRATAPDWGPSQPQPEIAPVRQSYFSEGQREPLSAADLQRGYEIAPDQFVVVRPEELKRLRAATSQDMQILRSVRMQEIDPVFLETSYYVVPGPGGEHSYGLFYQALTETQLAALAQVAMHGREHVIVIRAGARGLIAHTMYYVNEVRAPEEYATDVAKVVARELDLAKKYVEALLEPFRPEEFTDRYREQLEALIASKNVSQPVATGRRAPKVSGNVIDIMEALRKSLETAKATGAQRKPASSEARSESKQRKRKA